MTENRAYDYSISTRKHRPFLRNDRVGFDGLTGNIKGFDSSDNMLAIVELDPGIWAQYQDVNKNTRKAFIRLLVVHVENLRLIASAD